MRWSVASVAILVAACAEDRPPDSGADLSSCAALPPASLELLDELVGYAWEGVDCLGFGPCNPVRFHPDGVFEHGPEVRSRWYATGDRSHGLVYVDSGSTTYAFSLTSNLLAMGGEHFGRGVATGASINSAPPPLNPPALLCTLTATSWKKSNPFDDFRRPENLRFGADGTFAASYRGGSCTHLGSYSILENATLRPISERNDCGLGEGGRFSATLVDWQVVPVVVDGTLMIGNASYQPDDGAATDDVVIFEGFSGLRTVVSTPDFGASGPVELTVEIRNVADEVANGVRFELVHKLPDGGVSSLVSHIDTRALPVNGSTTFGATMEMPAGSTIELEFMSAPLASESWVPHRVRYEP